MMKPDIRYGELIDVIGSPLRFDKCTFVPALTRLNGTSFSPQLELTGWCRENSTTLPLIARGDENAPWVLGRLIYLFNTANVPESERGEKCCFTASFVAVLHDANDIAVPFDASDSYGQTSLWFSSEDEPPRQVRIAIADGFYRLLLDEPESLCDYENRMFHPGASVWIDFGVSCGEPYMNESID